MNIRPCIGHKSTSRNSGMCI